jgi:hypothetical protein
LRSPSRPVSGDVSPYNPAVDNPPGTTPAAGDATKLNVTILNPDVVIASVIVKGGPAANVYATNVVNMISPKNPGGNVPAISHYLICYNFGGPPPRRPARPVTVPPWDSRKPLGR